MQRSRNSGSTAKVTVNKTYDAAGTLIGTSNYPWTLLPVTSEVSVSDYRGKSSINGFFHWKRQLTDHDTQMQTYTPVNPMGNLGTYTNNNFGITDQGPPSSGSPKNGESQFMLRGIQALRPKFKADVSVPNFLFELKDLTRIMPTRDFDTLAAALSSIPLNPFSKKGRKIANDSSNVLASQYLSAQFGYLPLISDLEKLIDGIKNYNAKLEEFKKNAGKLRKGNHTESISDIIGPKVVYYRGSNLELYTKTDVTEQKVTLTLRYGYTTSLPDLKSPFLFTKYLGFRANPRILWDAIPFSFVIDWMLRFGKTLESFDDGAIPVTMRITGACISYKYRAKIRYFANKIENSVGNYGWSDSPTGTLEFDVYNRRVLDFDINTLMAIPPLPVFDGLSQKEVTLGVALGKTLTHKG